MATDSVLINVVNKNNFNNQISSLLENYANTTISNGNTFKVGLSGGSLVTLLKDCLPSIETDWSRWVFFFCDERVVSFDDPDSTFGCYKVAFQNLPIDVEKQFVTIEPNLKAEAAAADYQKKLKGHFADVDWPSFDVLLLGLGPDGHTCSLFPGHPLLSEDTLWVAPITDSPKPPPSRVTLTYPVLNRARLCVFPICGKGKANMVKRILKDKEDFPAGRVKPVSGKGKVIWLLDEDAGSELA